MSNIVIPGRVILRHKSGSHSYGTATPESDLDIRGIFIANKIYYHGFVERVEQVQDKKNDITIFEIIKYFTLAAKANPNILESLFVRDEDIIEIDELGEKLRAHRDLFLSTKCRWTYAGYAHANLKRLENHRNWLLYPLKAPPTRAEYGLPEQTLIPNDQLQAALSLVQRTIDTWMIDFLDMPEPDKIYITKQIEKYLVDMNIFSDEKWQCAARSINLSDNFIDAIDRERKYNAAKIKWKQYKEWEINRNPKRAALERKWGHDTKHSSNLIRLMRTCVEILEHNTVYVFRQDAEELLAIKNGARSYESLVEEAEQLENKANELYKTSTLPHSVDYNKLDALCIELVEASHNKLK
jgi:uncharacterized protein